MTTKTITRRKCQRCGYEWYPTKDTPLQCPTCKSYRWNVPKKGKEE